MVRWSLRKHWSRPGGVAGLGGAWVSSSEYSAARCCSAQRHGPPTPALLPQNNSTEAAAVSPRGGRGEASMGTGPELDGLGSVIGARVAAPCLFPTCRKG